MKKTYQKKLKMLAMRMKFQVKKLWEHDSHLEHGEPRLKMRSHGCFPLSLSLRLMLNIPHTPGPKCVRLSGVEQPQSPDHDNKIHRPQNGFCSFSVYDVDDVNWQVILGKRRTFSSKLMLQATMAMPMDWTMVRRLCHVTLTEIVVVLERLDWLVVAVVAAAAAAAAVAVVVAAAAVVVDVNVANDGVMMMMKELPGMRMKMLVGIVDDDDDDDVNGVDYCNLKCYVYAIMANLKVCASFRFDFLEHIECQDSVTKEDMSEN